MIQSVIRTKEFFTKCERTIKVLEDLITPSPKGRRTAHDLNPLRGDAL